MDGDVHRPVLSSYLWTAARISALARPEKRLSLSDCTSSMSLRRILCGHPRIEVSAAQRLIGWPCGVRAAASCQRAVIASTSAG